MTIYKFEDRTKFEAFHNAKKQAEGLPKDLYRYAKPEDVGDTGKAIEVIPNGQAEWYRVSDINPSNPNQGVFESDEELSGEVASANQFTALTEESYLNLLKNNWVE